MNRTILNLTYKLLMLTTLLVVVCSAGAQQVTSDSLFSKVEQLGKTLLYRNFDSTYIKSYDDKFNVHLLSSNKANFFQLRDKNTNSNLFYRPDLGILLGAGVSYNWFAVDLSFSSWIQEKSELTNNDFFDFQGRIFSSKQYIEATLQYYYGYKLTSVSTDYDSIPSEFKARNDMRSIHINLQYLFAFNYTKFSMKAPFVYNQTQQKSAGSPVAGAGFSMYIFDADSSMVPSTVSEKFDSKLHLRDFNNLGISISVGYMYSFVVKKRFYYTIGLIPGLDLNMGDYFVDHRERMDPNFSYHVKFMNALGYNGPKIYSGVQFYGYAFRTRIDKKLEANIGYTKVGFIFGYRF